MQQLVKNTEEDPKPAQKMKMAGQQS